MSNQNGYVTVTNIKISFGRLIVLFVKLGLAAIPAAIILALIWGLVVLALGALFGGLDSLNELLTPPSR
ncbi:MAG: hypothetical protein Q8P46_14035 [Hyphomicrobiales bacterium]|nr:hypothetical protein [Hyphomicrobiales bacterium]